MARISLWKPIQGNDFNFVDRQVRDYMSLSGTGVYVHKYLGPSEQSGLDNKTGLPDGTPTDETTIGDILFVQNRDRKYDSSIYELRGTYHVSDTDFDLSQFGIMLSDNIVFMSFHLNENVERLGRKLMPGDVLELPHLREYFPLDDEKDPFNRFYVVEDASYSAEGYGPKWWPHVWRVRAKVMPASTEYRQILERGASDGQGLESLPPGEGDNTLAETIVGGGSEELNEELQTEAAVDVPYDSLFYDASNFWVYVDPNTQEHALIPWKSGDGQPPNGEALYGSGDTFPDAMPDNSYYLRTDFEPHTLFQKRGTRFYRIEADQRKTPWTGANQTLDSFVDNDNITTNDDGTTEPEKQALSKAVLARTKEGSATRTPAAAAPLSTTPVTPHPFSDQFSNEFE